MIKLLPLLEGTYASETLRLSREIIRDFKLNFGKRNKKEYGGSIINRDPELRDLGGNPEEMDFDLIVIFIPVKNLQGDSYEFSAITSGDEIKMIIKYIPIIFPAAYNEFIAELKETIRHELEHLLQFYNSGKPNVIKERSNTPFYKYLQYKHEIPAYVHGLYTRAKTKKITLTAAIEEFLEESTHSFKNDKEKDIVRKVWTTWAKKNLKSAQL